MRIDWRTDQNAPVARVFDQETGEQLTPLAMADDATGEYEMYLRDESTGRFQIDPDTGRVKTVKRRAKLRIEVMECYGCGHEFSERHPVSDHIYLGGSRFGAVHAQCVAKGAEKAREAAKHAGSGI